MSAEYGSDLAQRIVSAIDHTLLRPDASSADIARLCEEARQWGFAAVCVHPLRVEQAARTLAGRGIAVCTVIDFPHGAGTAASKAFEAKEAVAAGATELDMVIPVGALKEGDTREVLRHIEAVVKAASQAIVKVIIEACLLEDSEKETACQLAMEAGARFVKTSTGFGGGGATLEDVRLMRSVVGERLGVKAAGGIRTAEDAVAMFEAGATRIGTSSGVAIARALLGREPRST